MAKEIYSESITKFSYGFFTVRIWRKCHIGNDFRVHSKMTHEEAEKIFKANAHGLQTMVDLAIKILLIDDVNGVEILQTNTGNGVVLYANWP